MSATAARPAAADAITVAGLAVRFGDRLAVDGFDLVVPAGGWTCLIGPNGAGKTTVLRALAGLVGHDGQVRLGGLAPGTVRRRARARHVAYVPQRPVLPPEMTVDAYALLGRTPHIGYFGVESAADRTVAAAALARLDLDGFGARPLGELSGGEAQRVVLARALAQEAAVLLLDEPTSALDLGHGQQVLELVDELRHERGLTVVSAMHDLSLAGQFADELVMLRDGRAAGRGRPGQVLTEAALLAHYGAHVRVHTDADGHVVVVPARPPR